MYTPQRPRDPSHEDLTARARIRDAAMAEFADHGIKGASIRGIARAAGVSPALVQHHFGTKDELRATCDQYVLDFIRRIAGEMLDGDPQTPDLMGAVQQFGTSFLGYIARSLADGTETAKVLFDEFVELTDDYLKNLPPEQSANFASDTRTIAIVLVSMRAGMWVMRDQIARSIGSDEMGMNELPRIGTAMLDILSPNLLSPDVEPQLRRLLTEEH